MKILWRESKHGIPHVFMVSKLTRFQILSVGFGSVVTLSIYKQCVCFLSGQWGCCSSKP